MCTARFARTPVLLGAGTLWVLTALIAACGQVSPNDFNNQNENTNASCPEDTTRCELNQLQHCSEGVWTLEEACNLPTPLCSESVGCVACVAGESYCDPDTGEVRACNADSTPGPVLQQCTADRPCYQGACMTACDRAAANNSYTGCDYWSTTTANPMLSSSFSDNFGLVVHNGTQGSAHVTVRLGGDKTLVAEADVAPGQLHTFALDYFSALSLQGELAQSVQAENSSYHVESDQPVTVYQFNPLDFAVGTTHSYTNDAALLLPTQVLSQRYLVMSRSTWAAAADTEPFQFTPGYFAVVGTEDNTVVTVTYSAHTQSGDISGASPGDQREYTLRRGEVLQVMSALPGDCSEGTQYTDDCNGAGLQISCTYCDMGAQYDLTGTRIDSSAPVAIFAGHACALVPYNALSCDHLEEQLFPLQTWGKDYLVARTEPQHQAAYPEEPNVVRILSGADGNQITFEPPQSVGSTMTLAQGEYVEFEATEDFRVTGTEALLVAQFLVGQNRYSLPTPDVENAYWGDPSFALVVPLEQYRTQYGFLAPSTFPLNYVNVVKPIGEGGAAVILDGVPIPESEFAPTLGEYGVARLPISGAHHQIESALPFGISVYGFASYTSYSYPGGLDLKYINPVQ